MLRSVPAPARARGESGPSGRRPGRQRRSLGGSPAAVAFEFTADRRAVSPDQAGDLSLRQPRRPADCDLLAFGQRQVPAGRGPVETTGDHSASFTDPTTRARDRHPGAPDLPPRPTGPTNRTRQNCLACPADTARAQQHHLTKRCCDGSLNPPAPRFAIANLTGQHGYILTSLLESNVCSRRWTRWRPSRSFTMRPAAHTGPSPSCVTTPVAAVRWSTSGWPRARGRRCSWRSPVRCRAFCRGWRCSTWWRPRSGRCGGWRGCGRGWWPSSSPATRPTATPPRRVPTSRGGCRRSGGCPRRSA